MARKIQDHYFREAKREGYLARAAYKLIEIDDRKHVVRRGDRVLDAGCAPGSWLQVLEKRVGPGGRVYGIDLLEVDARRFGPTVRAVIGDIEQATLEELLGTPAPDGPAFDAIVSDLGPATTGDPFSDSQRSVALCHLLLDRAVGWLRRGGNMVMKVYEGEAYPGLLQRCRASFEQARGFKPKASRAESVEMYLVCHGYRPEATSGDETPAPLPRRRSSPGWS